MTQRDSHGRFTKSAGIAEERAIINGCNEEPVYDAVNPPHYTRGPSLHLGTEFDRAQINLDGIAWARGIDSVNGQIYTPINAIDIMRCIQDPRLATAFKYIWRLAFGGKREPGDERPQGDIDKRDALSAAWYLTDHANNVPMYHTGDN